MKPRLPIAVFFSAMAMMACDKPLGAEKPPQTPPPPQTLAEARKGFVTHLVKKERAGESVEPPPGDLFTLVHYPSPAGQLAAYISRIREAPGGGGGPRPAIIWLVGGFSSSIGDVAWTPGPPSNDQSASTFWHSGIVTMYPSYRGGNDNPGYKESFFGEVDDVLAAAEFLAKTPGIDPHRIYLGGHSTGGTLALLTAESAPVKATPRSSMTDSTGGTLALLTTEAGSRFRAVFSLGPVGDLTNYGDDALVFDRSDKREAAVRAPIRWMQGITSPTFVFEGASGRSNIASLRALSRAPHSAAVHFYPVSGADHFSTIQRISRLIAAKILADKDSAQVVSSISFTAAEIDAAR